MDAEHQTEEVYQRSLHNYFLGYDQNKAGNQEPIYWSWMEI